MALFPSQLEQLPENIVNIYQELEDFILKDFAKRLSKAGTIQLNGRRIELKKLEFQ